MDTRLFKYLLTVKNQAQSTLIKLDKIEKEFTKENFTEKLREIKTLVKSLEIRVFQGFDAMAMDLIEKTK